MELITLKNDTLLITSLIVAEQLKRDHSGIIKTIENNKESFEKFGVLGIEFRKPKKGSKGGRPEMFYYLNEQQLTFLIMMLRVKKNENDRVLEFKEYITKEFFRMRKALLQISINHQNKEWLESRQQGKKARKEVVSAYARYLEHAVEQKPDTSYAEHPENVYSDFTHMVNKALFDIEFKPPKGKTPRDFMEENQLSILGVAELTLQKLIHEEIDKDTDFKKIYKIAHEKMNEYADLVGKTTIIVMLADNKTKYIESKEAKKGEIKS
jgi:phage regulator Rha-like protein